MSDHFRKSLKAIVCVSLALLMFAGGLSVLPTNAKAEGTAIPVSQGTSVTIWEATGWISSYEYSTASLVTGATFSTVGSEIYYVSTDGTYLTIGCDRYSSPYPAPRDPWTTGNNICGVLLSGVPGYPDGLWATDVVSYQLGAYGAAESLPNALGPWDAPGTYHDAPCTFLGDGWSEMTLAFVPTAPPLPLPPVAEAGPNQLVRAGDTIYLDGTASIASADCTYTWESPGYVTLEGAQVSWIVPTDDLDSSIRFWLTVTDTYGQSATDTVDIFVTIPLGTIHKGDTALKAGFGHSIDTTMSLTFENHGLKSVTVLVSWPFLPKSNNIVMKINFADNGAFPTGEVTTATVNIPAESMVLFTIKDPDGLRGGYADIWYTWLPTGAVIG